MTRAEILIVFLCFFGATFLVGPYDYEGALITDAIRKDPPMPPQIVFESKGELNYMTYPVAHKRCTATVNGKCYISKTDRMRYGE